jgi:hypothetical protein
LSNRSMQNFLSLKFSKFNAGKPSAYHHIHHENIYTNYIFLLLCIPIVEFLFVIL